MAPKSWAQGRHTRTTRRPPSGAHSSDATCPVGRGGTERPGACARRTPGQGALPTPEWSRLADVGGPAPSRALHHPPSPSPAPSCHRPRPWAAVSLRLSPLGRSQDAQLSAETSGRKAFRGRMPTLAFPCHPTATWEGRPGGRTRRPAWGAPRREEAGPRSRGDA